MKTENPSAYDTWKKAGALFAQTCLDKNKSTAELGEASFVYAASRGLPHQDIIRRAFREGFLELKAKGES